MTQIFWVVNPFSKGGRLAKFRSSHLQSPVVEEDEEEEEEEEEGVEP